MQRKSLVVVCLVMDDHEQKSKTLSLNRNSIITTDLLYNPNFSNVSKWKLNRNFAAVVSKSHTEIITYSVIKLSLSRCYSTAFESAIVQNENRRIDAVSRHNYLSVIWNQPMLQKNTRADISMTIIP